MTQPDVDTVPATLASSVDRAALLAADQRFFDALVASDHATLEDLLAPGFLIVDVHSGSIGTRAELLRLVRSGALAFPAIQVFPEESIVRRAGSVGIVVGRTGMRLRGQDGPEYQASSRYTHVFTAASGGTGDDGETAETWRLLSAQGTEIR